MGNSNSGSLQRSCGERCGSVMVMENLEDVFRAFIEDFFKVCYFFAMIPSLSVFQRY